MFIPTISRLEWEKDSSLISHRNHIESFSHSNLLIVRRHMFIPTISRLEWEKDSM